MASTALFEHFSLLIDLPKNQHVSYFNQHISDPSQAEELKALLNNHFSNSDKTQWHELIAQQAQDITGDEQLDDLLGSNLGVYTLTEVIGEGGMGIVFLAERNDGMMQQQVAIKFLFPSIVHVVGSKLVHNQAQILARLNHPNITQVYDAGTSPTGLHYVVMEYVAGQPIDLYCQQQKLNFIERVHLFLDVCDAITKTHLINIAHSDIKPGNVLVNKDGLVKILDFDIAKMLHSNEQEAEDDSVKRYLRALSLAYASPEQLTGQMLTLATDQYSLAVLFYVLLSEQTPFDIERKNINELVEDIQSGRAKTLVINQDHIQITIGQHWAMVSDMAKIITKAMSANVNDRYPTVAAFKSDIHKTLKYFPTEVNYSLWQRAKKWLIRKPLLALVYAVLIIASLSFAVQNENIEQERNLALIAQQYAEQKTQLAERDKMHAVAVASQLANILKQKNTNQTQAERSAVKAMLMQGYESIMNSSTLNSVEKLHLVQVIVESYLNQKQHQAAITALERTLDISELLMQDIVQQLPLSLLLIETYLQIEQRLRASTFVERLKKAISSQGHSSETEKLLLLAERALSQA
ncbi:serine/threonine protein kinase [Colwellia sp. M166]|uniref:serine/threonine protein kinase n=1 Tax=Colwellia sp. M166 TaxID=2583805 RepID=UPI00211DE49B|nr:serine/threonine-protein kinase [Colwellia sp. M166]UUO23209.1 serine/threonine protein kinase [Colwellia sp. M166]|tara:strand:- start:18027 stop:19763 length:1737 start_codon:yes stop_codon:yes gene_type:complete